MKIEFRGWTTVEKIEATISAVVTNNAILK